MLYPLDYLTDMPASSTSRKRKFISSCAPRTFFFILLYVILFISVLPGKRKSNAPTPRIPRLANTQQKRLPSSLSISAYARWHQQQRKCLIDPLCKHPPVLIWQCPENNASNCARVDDWMHGIQFSLLLSIATKRLFFIDWPASPHRLDNALMPATFDWKPPISVHRNSPVLNWFSGIDRRRDGGYKTSIRHLPAPQDRELDLNLEADDVKARLEKYPVLRIWTRLPPHLIQNIKSSANFADSLSTYKKVSILDVQRMLLASLFKPSRDLMRVMKSVVKIDIQRDYYSIFFNTGGDISDDQNLPLWNGKKTMNDLVDEIMKCLRQERNLGHVFVTSDSMKFKTLLKEKAQSENIKVFISQRPVRNLGAQNRQLTSQDEKYLSFLYYFADLFLLGGAKHIITTESNFADIAFLFGTASKLIHMKGLTCTT